MHTINCKRCQKVFKTPYKTKLYCDRKCKEKASSQRNKKVSTWKIRDFCREVKGLVKECEICGYDNRLGLVTHHVSQDRSDNSLNNLMVLCANCHQVYHMTVGYGNKAENQSKDYVRHVLHEQEVYISSTGVGLDLSREPYVDDDAVIKTKVVMGYKRR